MAVATFLPSLNSCQSKMTPGEKRFATRLHTNLDESFHCWYDVSVGTKRSRYPDFILLHADLGLLLLEVKDWSRENIRHIDKQSATILFDGVPKTRQNPMEQVRQCAYALTQQLERDPQLLHHAGRYKGRLQFPYGYGVVFPNIASTEHFEEGWIDIFPAHRTIYRDQMTESIDADDFRATLESIFDVGFSRPLTEPMMDRVRWYIFPEIRIATTPDLFAPDISVSDDAVERKDMKQLDIEQEKLARHIGDGHRVIRGVAGSGKTQIIAYRCQYFAEASAKPVLVLYYNIAAKSLLRSILKARGVLDRVEVRHFHEWCADQVRRAGAAFWSNGSVIESFADALRAGKIPAGQYSTIMVDEGKDFEQDWLKLIAEFCEPEKLPLLFVYDDAQSIYERERGLGFTLASAGISARGRTTVMKVNYRSPEYIQQFASRFLYEVVLRTAEEAEREEWLQPVGVGNTGTPPQIVACISPMDEFKKVARWIDNLHRQRGVPWHDICVIVRARHQAERLSALLAREGIPAYDISASRESKEATNLSDPSVKIATVHSSKGLEFPNVLVTELCGFADTGPREIDDARLLYVAMTRSTDRLVLTAWRETPLVERMRDLIEEVTEAITAEKRFVHEI